MGASLLSKKEEAIKLDDLIKKIQSLNIDDLNTTDKLDPLFKDENDYNEFIKRHNKNTIKTCDISKFNGNCFLGIDAGSTTTKAALIDDKGNLLYTHYSSNEGKPLEVVIDIMNKIYNAAMWFITCNPVYSDTQCSFDVISIQGYNIEYSFNSFNSF